MAKIMIDPGHSAWNVNRGAVPEYYEGTMAFRLACHLQEALKAYGIQADRTKAHVNDDHSLWDRGRMADGYDFFISLHSDACGTEAVDRCTIFRMVPDSTSGIDEKSGELARLLAPAISETMGLHDQWQVKAKHASGDRNHDGVDNDNWMGVLHAAQSVSVPGILIEHGFHTNRAVCRWLLDEDNLRRLAQVEASVIAQYFGISSPSGYIDVPTEAWYADSVRWATETGIASGTGHGMFSPDDACTRAQAVTMLWRLVGSPEPDGAYEAFTDVQPTAWYARAVQWAVQNGITNGVDGRNFGPDLKCTRAQIVTFLWRAACSPAAEGDEFDDVSQDDYFRDAVHWAFARGITSGIYPRHFGPNEPCTRAMIVTMLWAAKKYI